MSTRPNDSAPLSAEPTQPEIDRLVESLNSLHDGELAVDALIGCGERAIAPLRNFLMTGRPSVVHQPRQRAVRALAELGAREVLVEYLTKPKSIRDAAVRMGEEAVENAAARALGAWKTDEVYWALLAVARSRMLSGVIEALGSFKRPEAIPYLINALGDDISRRDAERGLRAMGEIARTALVEAARTPDPSRPRESPSSLARRRSALRILAALAPKQGLWPKLQALLGDEDHEVAVSVASLALKIGAPDDQQFAVQRLIELLPAVNWLLQSEIESSLLEHFQIAQAAVRREIQHRLQLAKPQQAKDVTLRTLLNVVRQVEASGNDERQRWSE